MFSPWGIKSNLKEAYAILCHQIWYSSWEPMLSYNSSDYSPLQQLSNDMSYVIWRGLEETYGTCNLLCSHFWAAAITRITYHINHQPSTALQPTTAAIPQLPTSNSMIFDIARLFIWRLASLFFTNSLDLLQIWGEHVGPCQSRVLLHQLNYFFIHWSWCFFEASDLQATWLGRSNSM